MTLFLPRESIEFVPVTVTLDDVVITSGVTFAVTTAGTRPTSWSAPTSLSGKIGVMVSGLAPGAYVIWAKVASSPETPILECGAFTIV